MTKARTGPAPSNHVALFSHETSKIGRNVAESARRFTRDMEPSCRNFLFFDQMERTERLDKENTIYATR